MAPIFNARLRRTISCATDLNPKASHEIIKVKKVVQKPPTANCQGRPTLYGRFSGNIVPSNHVLAQATTERQFLELTKLHPMEDPTLVGTHTLIPLIRRHATSNEWLIDRTQQEIHPCFVARSKMNGSLISTTSVVTSSQCVPLIEWPPLTTSPRMKFLFKTNSAIHKGSPKHIFLPAVAQRSQSLPLIEWPPLAKQTRVTRKRFNIGLTSLTRVKISSDGLETSSRLATDKTTQRSVVNVGHAHRHLFSRSKSDAEKPE